MRQTLGTVLMPVVRVLVMVLSNRKFIRVLSNPALLVRSLLRHMPDVPVETKVALDLYDRPTYGYGLWTAAKEAKALGLAGFTAIEFGVATGNGLLAMERVAQDVEAATGVQINIVGFDNAAGLPPPEDYRDLPYLYGQGYYSMDVDALRSRLTNSQLVLGDVRDTVRDFLGTEFPPIGFISFDLDYYSSTKAAFAILEGDSGRYLPRIVCYFDDIGNADALQCTYTGEALAIQEFNEARDDAKIDQIVNLRGSRLIDANWPDFLYACHLFHHPLYNTQVVAGADEYVSPLVSAVNYRKEARIIR